MLGLFNVLRRLETWLHQHIFKVGWLTTKNFQTTTILYYAFFLPGVLLYEFVFWLAAGLLNVRAERAIKWPEAQEIGEIRLNFVQLAPHSSPLRVAVITTIPFLMGIILMWYIANNVFLVPVVLDTLTPNDGPVNFQSLNAALQQLLSTADFWLWFYVAFTVSNTTFFNLPQLSGYRILGITGGVAVVVVIVLGLGNTVILGILNGPVATVLNDVSAIFAGVIVMNAFMVGVLSAIENTIEWITGDSADFQNGKMIVMTREERQSRRLREIERQRQTRERKRSRQREAATEGPPSIYRTPLPLPGPPGDVPVTALTQVIDDKPEAKPPSLERAGRGGASLITGQSDEQRLPSQRQPGLPAPQLAEGDDPVEDEEEA